MIIVLGDLDCGARAEEGWRSVQRRGVENGLHSTLVPIPSLFPSQSLSITLNLPRNLSVFLPLLFVQFSIYTWVAVTPQTASVSLVPEFSQQKFSCAISKGIATYSTAEEVGGVGSGARRG